MLPELTKDPKELVPFIIDRVNDATHIKADKEELMKIIDISVNSAMRFNGIKNDIADYFCNSVPQLNQLNSKAPVPSLRSGLKLIVNNL